MKSAIKSLILVLFLLPVMSFTSEESISEKLNKLIKETQLSASGDGSVAVQWWIPMEFWDLSLRSQQTLSENQIKDFLSTMKPYAVFAVVDGDFGPMGGVKFRSKEDFEGKIKLLDKDSTVYNPVDYNDLDADVRNLFEMMKPMLKNMMGQMGENFHFFVFSDYNNEERIADPKSANPVRLIIDDEVKIWRTPLGSLMPPKKCPIDGEEMSGAWSFCPYHGEKLVTIKN